ncbi:cysteine--tRNA ligase [Gorillibacterium timonense]|uniref:cysteine--tRNA ligase n=1 Tax=Gorillibacterium timonense TaxID=1689269 RepID=UPI00071E1E9C|nr:cysteine--tRNA ligase [Gorillibacterium timonense]
MTLSIYNTLTRTKEEFRPIEPGKVRMYVCGPTVYDYIHIGNSRPVIFFDAVRRYLEFSGYDVKYVVNFTDVDDKLIKRSEERGIPVPELASTYIQAFLKDSEALRADKALHPRVTENIEEIIAFIAGLVENGSAYESGGDVFFRTKAYPKYGQISHKNLDELQHGIRIEVDERKESPHDFVLWKKAKPGEIRWPSPWGDGRPGWHIECSAMAAKYLGETIDIHGGGEDLEFPHHECEAAQSEALTGKPLARYWMHNRYLNIAGEKMSKSLGNGLSVRAILQSAKPEAIRYVILSTHYRNPINFNDESLKQGEAGVERLNNSFTNLIHRLQILTEEKSGWKPDSDEALDALIADGNRDDAEESVREASRALNDFVARMDDDFNTPDAITAMFDLAAATNKYLLAEQASVQVLQILRRGFERMDSVLGLLYSAEPSAEDAEIEQLIEDRQEARRTRNFGRADEIRNELTERGIILEDTPQGIRWRRK